MSTFRRKRRGKPSLPLECRLTSQTHCFELFAERRNGKEAQVWPDAELLLDRRPTSFDEFAKRNAAVFRGDAPPPKV